ncbi:MAG: DNA polymerase IV [Pseudoflavonifractor sp.]|nr:DNA polymerase IV [Pseudoflavonifractor sp.]
MERVILHCDLNSFYASVELLDCPELKEVPVAVCGDPESRHGIILAKNEAAKAFGVKTAETVWQARKKCQDLILLPAHHEKYHHYSRLVNDIYERYTDLVEPFSIDESWLDVTGSLHLFHTDGKGLADQLRQEIRRELDLTISVGVSFNKIFAKMGSDYQKPDATTVITRENFRTLLWPLPVDSLIFVGASAARTLGEYGIRTIGDLARFDRSALSTILGRQGAALHDYANGVEHTSVIPARELPPPKSVGNGLTFPKNLLGWEELGAGVALLSDEVAARLRRLGQKCATVQIAVRDPSFRDISRQKGLPVPTYLARELSQAVMELLHQSWNPRSPVRALTVTAQNLLPADDAGEQLNLLTPQSVPQREKVERLERTMDGIRNRYGKDSITSARLKKAPSS